MKTVKTILSKDAFWQVNKKIAIATSIDAALILAELVFKEEYFADSLVSHSDYPEAKFFYATSKEIEVQTTIRYKTQKKAIKLLEKEGFIITKLMGVPATLHFSICHKNIIEFLTDSQAEFCQNGESSFAKKAKLLSPKRQNLYIIKRNNKEKGEKEAPSSISESEILDLLKKSSHFYLKEFGGAISTPQIHLNQLKEHSDYQHIAKFLLCALKNQVAQLKAAYPDGKRPFPEKFSTYLINRGWETVYYDLGSNFTIKTTPTKPFLEFETEMDLR